MQELVKRADVALIAFTSSPDPRDHSSSVVQSSAFRRKKDELKLELQTNPLRAEG